jgi:hypothetical protein
VSDDRLARIDVQLVGRAVEPMVFRRDRRIENVADRDVDLADDRAGGLELGTGRDADRPGVDDFLRRMRGRCRDGDQQQ